MTQTKAVKAVKPAKGFYFTQPENVVMFDEALSQTSKVIYCSLLRHVRKGTNQCKLLVATIAGEINRSVRTVRRGLKQLCERGVICRLMQYGSNKNQLASIFVIIGNHAACYQDSSKEHQQKELQPAVLPAQKAITTESDRIEKDRTESDGTESNRTESDGTESNRTESEETKVSAPHAKNGTLINNKGKNENILKDTLIGQDELPKSCSQKSYDKKLKAVPKAVQRWLNFEACEACDICETCGTGQKENSTGAEGFTTVYSSQPDKVPDSSAQASVPAPKASEKIQKENCNFDPLLYVQDAEKIPNDMKDTARYFLYRTGRDPKTINEKEIAAMREVFVNHYPARIQKEIDTACQRFVKIGKSLRILFFGYIAAALKNQQSLIPFEKLAKRWKDGNIKQPSRRTAVQATEGQAAGGRATELEMSQSNVTDRKHRYLTSDDIESKTNPLSGMSMEELLALEKELDGKMKGQCNNGNNG